MVAMIMERVSIRWTRALKLFDDINPKAEARLTLSSFMFKILNSLTFIEIKGPTTCERTLSRGVSRVEQGMPQIKYIYF